MFDWFDLPPPVVARDAAAAPTAATPAPWLDVLVSSCLVCFVPPAARSIAALVVAVALAVAVAASAAAGVWGAVSAVGHAALPGSSASMTVGGK